MRRAVGLSSPSSSFCAAGSNSIVHFGLEAIAAHYFFEWNGANPSGTNFCETLFGKIDVFEVFEVLKDRFTRVVSLGAAGALGEAIEAFFDVVGKADS